MEDGKILEIASSTGPVEEGYSIDSYEDVRPDTEILAKALKTDHANDPSSKENPTLSPVETPNESILDEKRKSGNPQVYKYYFASAGTMQVVAFVVSVVLWVFCSEFPSKSLHLILGKPLGLADLHASHLGEIVV